MSEGITAYVTQQCSVCKAVAIRVPVGRTSDKPVCKWCETKEERDVHSPGTEVVHGGARTDFSGADVDL
jgi:hypothetical protein